ncbi:RNA polymerase sigma factor SigM [Roseovarius albus]|uniref:RNA polymerase sigma factor SigZ n=1 Tax=Roseovarius albus TaxID=1247867 RepID=A0A1X6YGG9_9RHOB|nr:RNA polymerase sigma factor SigZ [Roseovarius albus]SLN20803.1 RNA polymerase sigma factor SigM [Roseovarius albus]
MTLEEIWQQYRARLKSFLHSKVSNPADVDDLLQEISIKTFTKLDALDDPTKVQAWLFQIAQHTIVDFYRAKSRSKKVHPDDLWYLEDEKKVLQDFEGCVEPFLSALPLNSVRMLRQIDFEGQSQKDYASKHNISYSTLKSRLKRARSELKAVFENCCHLTLDAQGNISDYRVKSDHCKNC